MATQANRDTNEVIVKNVVAKALDQLQPFVGEWTVEGRHVALPGTLIGGRSVFEWWGDRTLLIHRSTIDHPDFPDSIQVIGATRPNGGLALHYFDSRGVARVFDMTFDLGTWMLDRKANDATEFDQRLRATFSTDGDAMAAEWERSEPGEHEMKPDFSLLYARVNKSTA